MSRIVLGVTMAALLAFGGSGTFYANAQEDEGAEAARDKDTARMDYRARGMLTKGQEMLAQPQTEERGVKLLQSIPAMFPMSKYRFSAWSQLGQYYMGKRTYDVAIKQFEQMVESADLDEQAEALYRQGICYYHMNNFDKAFVLLRRVTNLYPWSIYANEAYYYVGQCHFKLQRWNNAIEALEMVGTSVPLSESGSNVAEAGQRMFIKIHDKDLVVLGKKNGQLKVTLQTKGGDREALVMEPLGKSGEYLIGSIQSQPGVVKVADGILQTKGGDSAEAIYIDENTADGTQRNIKRIAQVQLASTASAGFTDGAFNEYVRGIANGTACFVRVKDLDADISDAEDKLAVRLMVQYKIKRELEVGSGVSLDEEDTQTLVRDTIELELKETGVHTGIFTGSTMLKAFSDEKLIAQGDEVLNAKPGDELVVTYIDNVNVLGQEGREVKSSAQVLNDSIRDVESQIRVLTNPDYKARKNLIEAQIQLKLGQIFKDVGLQKKASEKADTGLRGVDDVLRLSNNASLSRELVEQAFSVKWELLLVQDKLNEAIGVCRDLTARFPDSALVDKALLKIGQANMAAGDYESAVRVFSGVLSLKNSTSKAEAQYNIAQIEENRAISAAKKSDRPANLAPAMLAYKKVSDQYPDSPFAGESLDKIANYYISSRDYDRAIELMQQVFTDYPDAEFLDKLMYKYMLAAFRSGRYQMAKDKGDELLNQYPSSPIVPKARQLLTKIEQRLGGGSGSAATDSGE